MECLPRRREFETAPAPERQTTRSAEAAKAAGMFGDEGHDIALESCLGEGIADFGEARGAGLVGNVRIGKPALTNSGQLCSAARLRLRWIPGCRR
jgi:hypothetical protein